MKTLSIALTSTLALACLTQTTLAQTAERPGRAPQMELRGWQHPLMLALDTDKDGELSSEEIDQATVALKKLDRNQDGKVDRMEMRPVSRGVGVGSTPGTRPSAGAVFAERIMRFDLDRDGKVTEEELPERMQRMLERADTNQDGAIDKSEAEKLGEQFSPADRRPNREPGRGSRDLERPE